MRDPRFPLVLLLAAAAAAQPGAIPDFAVVQLSDLHVEPLLAGEPGSRAERGEETCRWLAAALRGPQALWPGRPAPPPAFLVATGDLTEFGVPGRTWAAVERLLGLAGLEWYAVPGNHDQTWVPLAETMRRRHGGVHWAFDRFGCRFLGFSTATLLEPLPCLEAGALAWLEREARAAGRRPVLLFMHHPPRSSEFAGPEERRLLLSALDGVHVALIAFGHGHGVTRELLGGGIDCVQGGSTFHDGKGEDRRGCNVIAVQDGVLRVAYRYLEDRKKPTLLLEKPLAPLPMDPPPFRLVRPAPGEAAGREALLVEVEAPPAPLRLLVDGIRAEASWRRAGGRSRCRLAVAGLAPGAHLLSVEEEVEGRARQRSAAFLVGGGPVRLLWRRELGQGVKGAPLVAGDLVVVATLWGRLAALSRATGQVRWERELGAEAAAGPAAAGELLLQGAGDGRVRAFGRDGAERWCYAAGAPVYAPAALAADRAYFADSAGRIHALEAATGRAIWVSAGSGYTIEAAPAAAGDLVVAGAWDGSLRAFAAATGEPRWSRPGPRAAQGAARYYAPADVSPVWLGERLFVCDRGWWLGTYTLEGEFTDTGLRDVAAIGSSPDGSALNARLRTDRLLRLDAEGRRLWEAEVPTGRLPVPPVEQGGRIWVCSDGGLVSALAAKDGRVLGAYRATPGLRVMAPPAVDGEGVVYVAGMDGSVAALRL